MPNEFLIVCGMLCYFGTGAATSFWKRGPIIAGTGGIRDARDRFIAYS
ncbi:MAG TPA: hypothetical protein VNW72_06585 [Chthoniobacterales bacterium]|nr:hypothetical protein [Chthoniobacterales bacterium]